MLKELIQFTDSVLEDKDFKTYGLSPKLGLHLVLKVDSSGTQLVTSSKPEHTFYSKKIKNLDALQKKCAAWSQAAWMVSTNKCFDLPSRAIHTCSPFCFAVKRENLEGGEKFKTNNSNGKSQVYDRVGAYFAKGLELLDTEEDQQLVASFTEVLSDKHLLHQWLANCPEYEDLKDGEYVVFYLDLPLEKYQEGNEKYLKEKLFNTADYNQEDEVGTLFGTSNFYNSFPNKKPFLQHQTATFDVANRISSRDAKVLYEFGELSRRGLFPRPLPLFILKEEVREKAIKIIKREAGKEKPRGYQEIILELYEDYKGELGNYYLLFQQGGEIKDFDFVSKFEYYLKDREGDPWQVEDLFNTEEMTISNVFELQSKVLPIIFNNALVVRRKDGNWSFKYFDDLDPQYCKTYNTYLMIMKYRKAFYDYIYKSKTQAIDGTAIKEILLTGIIDDIRLDDKGFNIRNKLNLLFNLHAYFSKPINQRFMAENIIQLRAHIDKVALSQAHLETDEQFAFAAGQMVDRIFYGSKTGDKSFKYLEPFLNHSKPHRLKEAIAKYFQRYSHIEYPPRFRNVSSEVLTFPVKEDIKSLIPVFLAGVFSQNQLHWDKKETTDISTTN